MDFPTHRTLFDVARDGVLAGNTKLTVDVLERDGTDANILTNAMATVGDEVVTQLATVETGLYLDSAKGTRLDRLVFDRYGFTRLPASPALDKVTFSVPTATLAPFSIPRGTSLSTSDNIRYITTQEFVFPANTTSLPDVPVQSVLSGISQQVVAGAISAILDTITGAPSGLAVTNPLASSGAGNGETDDEYRARARSFFVTARRGTVGAIQAQALFVPGVRTATAFEILDELGRPAQAVQLIVTDQYTQTLVNNNQNPPTYQTQSQALADLVSQSLFDTRAAGIGVQTFVAVVSLLSIQLALTFAANANIEVTTQQAKAAVINYTNALQAGVVWSRADATNALRSVPGLVVTGNEIYSPSGNVVPAQLQVIRTDTSLVNTVVC